MSLSDAAHIPVSARPLARAEVRVMLDRLLDKTSSFALSQAHHGTPATRKLDYEPSYIIRGLEHLYVDLVAS
jgi:hypothetical protein